MKIFLKNKMVYSLLLLVLSSCSINEYPADYYQPEGPLTVSLDKTTTSAKTPFALNFTGFADSLIFWSGKEGHMYEYRDRTEMDGTLPTLSFTSYRQWGAQENTLHILISKDYETSVTDLSAAIQQATWTDVTSQATLSTGTDNTPSGTISLLDFLGNERPIVIAFHFTGETGSTQRTWTLKNLVLSAKLPNGLNNELATTGTAGWQAYSFQNPSATWTFNTSQLQIIGGNATAGSNDDWLISAPIYLNKVEPDHGEVIKSRYQTMLKSFRFVYDEPGTYQVVVEGKDKTGQLIDDEHHFSIEVTE